MKRLKKEFQILGVRLDNLPPDEMLKNLVGLAQSTCGHQAVTVNPEFLVTACSDPDFRAILNRADLSLIDGAGLVLWGKILGKSNPIYRAPGVDFVYGLCREASQKSLKVFLLGGGPGIAQLAAEKLTALFPKLKIVGAESGGSIIDLKVEGGLLRRIKKAGPHILLVAFGHPKQDKWIACNRETLGVPLMMGIGGTFDFIAGKIRRAPDFLRKMGLEWLYRLWREPKRISRIGRAVFVFSYLVLKYEVLMRKSWGR